jgi:hypothetical protein
MIENSRIYLQSLHRSMLAAQRQIEWTNRLIEESREVCHKVSVQLAHPKPWLIDDEFASRPANELRRG